MSLFGFLKARGSAPVARERLQILLAHERVALGPRDLVTILRDELLATIARHIEIDPAKLSVKMDRSSSFSTLEIDVEIPVEKDRRLGAPPPRASVSGVAWARRSAEVDADLPAKQQWRLRSMMESVCFFKVADYYAVL